MQGITSVHAGDNISTMGGGGGGGHQYCGRNINTVKGTFSTVGDTFSTVGDTFSAVGDTFSTVVG